MLATRFPRCIGWRNKQGEDALSLATHSPSSTLIPTILPLFLSLSPSESAATPHTLLSSSDLLGNTPLHHACAWSSLPAVSTLLAAGADPHQRNHGGWTPSQISGSVQTEVAVRGIIEGGTRAAERGDRVGQSKRPAGIRMVSAEKVARVGGTGTSIGDMDGRRRAGSLN